MMATIDVFLVNVRLCFLVMNSGGRHETLSEKCGEGRELQS